MEKKLEQGYFVIKLPELHKQSSSMDVDRQAREEESLACLMMPVSKKNSVRDVRNYVSNGEVILQLVNSKLARDENIMSKSECSYLPQSCATLLGVVSTRRHATMRRTGGRKMKSTRHVYTKAKTFSYTARSGSSINTYPTHTTQNTKSSS